MPVVSDLLRVVSASDRETHRDTETSRGCPRTILYRAGWISGLLASASERPGHHQRELGLPEWVAVAPDPLGHHDVGTGITQCVRPAGRVLEEERLLCAGH